MEAIKLGPFVVPLVRLYVALALGGFLLAAELLARRYQPRLSAWAWNAVFIGLVAARLGYVLAHLGAFRDEPLAVFYFWQGGFSPFWGVLGGVLYTLWFFRRDLKGLTLILPPAAVGALVAAALFAFSARQATLAAVLPSFALPGLDGEMVSLAEYRGRPVVINVWATWCPPCRRELPLLAEVARARPEVAFLFVDAQEDAETVRAFLKRSGLELNNVLLDREGRVLRRLKVVALPTTVFFNAEGQAVARHMGELSRAALLDYLKKLGP